MNRLFKSLLLLFFILLSACSQRKDPAETVVTIMNLMEQRDFESLQRLVPFLAELDEEERQQIATSLLPYYSVQGNMSLERQGLNSYTVFISSENPADPTLIMTLKKGKEIDWILSDQISYRQSYEFIPLEKKE